MLPSQLSTIHSLGRMSMYQEINQS